jgi:hypothetical protein
MILHEVSAIYKITLVRSSISASNIIHFHDDHLLIKLFMRPRRYLERALLSFRLCLIDKWQSVDCDKRERSSNIRTTVVLPDVVGFEVFVAVL